MVNTKKHSCEKQVGRVCKVKWGSWWLAFISFCKPWEAMKPHVQIKIWVPYLSRRHSSCLELREAADACQSKESCLIGSCFQACSSSLSFSTGSSGFCAVVNGIHWRDAWQGDQARAHQDFADCDWGQGKLKASVSLGGLVSNQLHISTSQHEKFLVEGYMLLTYLMSLAFQKQRCVIGLWCLEPKVRMTPYHHPWGQ